MLNLVMLLIKYCTSDANGNLLTDGANTYTYNGDGRRVMEEYTGTATDYTKIFFMGGMVEVENDGTNVTTTKHYSIAGMRVAKCESVDSVACSGLEYFATDHLGSTVLVMDAAGDPLSEQRYLPFGGVRRISSVETINAGIDETDLGYTGQRNYTSFGLMDYRYRFLSTYLNRFTQPDTVIPNAANPQYLNHYTYVLNSPIIMVDPSGHNNQVTCGISYRCTPNKSENNLQIEEDSTFSHLPVDYDRVLNYRKVDLIEQGILDFGNLSHEYWIQWFGATSFADKFGWKWNYEGYCRGYHCGIDLAAPYGTTVTAGVSGTVWWAYEGSVYIDTADGYRIRYQNVMEIPDYMVNGFVVNPDTIIGVVGNHDLDPKKGNNHVHLEIYVDEYDHEGKWINRLYQNPLYFLRQSDIATMKMIAELQIIYPDNFYSAVILPGYTIWEPMFVDNGPGTLNQGD